MYKDVLSNSPSGQLHSAMSPSRPCSGSNVHPSPRKVATVLEAGRVAITGAFSSSSSCPQRHHVKKSNCFPRAQLWKWSKNSEKDEQMEAIMKDSSGLTVPVPLQLHNSPLANVVNIIKSNAAQKKKGRLQNKLIQANDLNKPSKNATYNNNNPSKEAWRSYKLAHRANHAISRSGQRSGGGTNSAKEHESLDDTTSKANMENAEVAAEALHQQQLEQQLAEEAAIALAEFDSRENSTMPVCHDEQVTEQTQNSTIVSHLNEEEERSQRPTATLSTTQEFWQIYKTSSTSKRPDSARGRFITNCEKNSLLVLPVLDLKPEGHHKTFRYDTKTATLRYDHYHLGDKRAKALGDALQLLPVQVKRLSMQNIGVTGSGSSAIVDGISMCQLTELSFSQNRIGMKGTATLFKGLQDTRVNLKRLDLGNNLLGDQCIKMLVQCLVYRCTLESLDLSGNNIYHSAKFIGELLRITSPLKELNLSWNNIRGDPALHLARCMKENLTLTNLDLSNNSLGNNGHADMEFGACLGHNKNLKHLNLSNNHIQGKAILVYVHSLQTNSTLETLNLCGNPIGSLGGETILRAIASFTITKCQIDIGNCNLEMIHTTDQLYLPLYCGGGKYTLNLHDKADVVFLKDLFDAFIKNKAEIQQVLHNGIPFLHTNFHIKYTKEALFEAIPTSGQIEIKIFPCYDREFDEPVCSKGFERLVDFIKRSFGGGHAGGSSRTESGGGHGGGHGGGGGEENDDAKLFCIKALTEEFVFSLDQANALLSLFRNHTSQLEKASAAAYLIPQIPPDLSLTDKEEEEIYDTGSLNPHVFFEDKDGDGKIDVCGDICMIVGFTQLTDIEQAHVEKKIGRWIAFNVKNPTGKYHLNLSNPVDRKILLRLFEANKKDRQFRTQYKLVDISATSDETTSTDETNITNMTRNCFRNVKLNHLPYILDQHFQIPRVGILEFDFVVTKRPYACCTPLNDQAFEKFLKEFKQLDVSGELKIIGLRAISSRYYFTCAQMQRVMEYFGTFERDLITGELFRAEVYVILYGRIIDEQHLIEPWSILHTLTRKKIKERIGVLNLFHPLQPLTTHELNLQFKDQRLLASILIKLSNTNEAELSSVTYQDKSCDENEWKTWTNLEENLFPRIGIFACTCRMVLLVKSETQLPATSYRKKLLQTLTYKIESKTQDISL